MMIRITLEYLLKNSYTLMRLSIGVVYIWFGFLKFFPGLSPAETLAERTIELLSFNSVEGHYAILILAGWEVLIGLALVINYNLKQVVPIVFLHMLCTIMPAFLVSELVFTRAPYGLTLTGQYIVKNAVFIAAALLLLQQNIDKHKFLSKTSQGTV